MHDELAALVLSHCAAMHQAAVSPPYALYTCAALRGIPYRTYNSTWKFKKKKQLFKRPTAVSSAHKAHGGIRMGQIALPNTISVQQQWLLDA